MPTLLFIAFIVLSIACGMFIAAAVFHSYKFRRYWTDYEVWIGHALLWVCIAGSLVGLVGIDRWLTHLVLLHR